MVKVIQLAEDGTETVTIEVDDFTIEVVYSGLADLLRAAAATSDTVAAPVPALPREARVRRQRVLQRVRT
jgi:hypothetical protein